MSSWLLDCHFELLCHSSAKSSVTDSSPAACLLAVMRLCFFPRTSPFAWLQHTSLSIVLCVAARGRNSLLFLVHECVREVLWVWDRPIHFTFVHQHLLYLRGSPAFMQHKGQFVYKWEFPLFSTKKKTKTACFPAGAVLKCVSVTDSFGLEPVQFSQVILLCS